MPSRCISSLRCWKPSSTSPRATSVPTGTPGGACTMRSRKASAMPQRSNSAQQRHATGPGGVADAARRQQRLAQRGLAADVRPRRAGAHRDGHAGMHQVGPAAGHARGPRPRSLSMASAASTTTSKASPASTRRAASTPPTDSKLTLDAAALPVGVGQVGQQRAGGHRRDAGQAVGGHGVRGAVSAANYGQPQVCRQPPFGTSRYRNSA